MQYYEKTQNFKEELWTAVAKVGNCCCQVSSVVSDSVRRQESAAQQAPPSLGFSRQEHWSGLPFPPPVHERDKWKWSRSVMSDSSWPHGLQPTSLLRPWDFPGKSTGVGCHCLLQSGEHYFLKLALWNPAMGVCQTLTGLRRERTKTQNATCVDIQPAFKNGRKTIKIQWSSFQSKLKEKSTPE